MLAAASFAAGVAPAHGYVLHPYAWKQHHATYYNAAKRYAPEVRATVALRPDNLRLSLPRMARYLATPAVVQRAGSRNGARPRDADVRDDEPGLPAVVPAAEAALAVPLPPASCRRRCRRDRALWRPGPTARAVGVRPDAAAGGSSRTRHRGSRESDGVVARTRAARGCTTCCCAGVTSARRGRATAPRRWSPRGRLAARLPSVTDVLPGDGQYCYAVVILDDLLHPSRLATAWYTQLSPPHAAFSWSADPGNAHRVVFSDGSTDAGSRIVSWHWDFGDGGSSTDRNPSHIYASGAHTVTLTVTDDGGQTVSASQGVSVAG